MDRCMGGQIRQENQITGIDEGENGKTPGKTKTNKQTNSSDPKILNFLHFTISVTVTLSLAFFFAEWG